ncbi:hypothetical protein [Vagococcus sp. WN89Y]|uniref:hypothetical protein n=1 Tax=Vagococcus sp. WN89Y TaxID=3457258 RepID=UPI003FCCD4ED
MINVNNTSPFRHIITTPDQPEEKETWFDAIDYVEMDEKWFDACETLPAETVAETLVPLTEDCRRCIKQLISITGDYKQSELLARGLAKLFPGIPGDILFAADSLYTAIMEKRNIDIAVLHTLGLTAGLLPDNINIISWVAGYIRRAVLDCAGAAFSSQFLHDEEEPGCGYAFMILAIAAIAARYWVRDEHAPQRRLLQVPAFIANLLVQASHYWKALANMVQAHDLPNKPPQDKPAFEIDTSIEIIQPLSENAASTQAPVIRAFLSNSTALPEFSTKATVENRTVHAPCASINIAENAHALAVEKSKRELGLSALLYCDTHKTETTLRLPKHTVTHSHFNTQCDATAFANQQRKLSIAGNTAPLGMAASTGIINDGKTALPLIATAAMATTAKTYLQVPRNNKLIVATALAGTSALVFSGKLLLDNVLANRSENIPTRPIASARVKRAVNSKKKKQTPNSIEKLKLEGGEKKIFSRFNLQSDISGKLRKINPQRLKATNILTLGTAAYNSEGFLTFTLPRKQSTIKATAAGIINSLKKGENVIEFGIRINTQTIKTLFFRISSAAQTEFFSMSKLGAKLIINHDGHETTVDKVFTSLTDSSKFIVTVNKGSASFITVNMDSHKVYSDLLERNTHQFFIGISCDPSEKYFRSVDIKDVSRKHTAVHPLHADWHNYISVAVKEGIKFDRAINPFSKKGIKFYGGAENLKIRKLRSEFVANMFVKLRHKRAIEGEATFTSVLNAASLTYLARVLGDPKVTRSEKELAVNEYLKTAAADAFSFSAGLVEHMDPFSLVSENYASGMKVLLKAGGAAVGIIFNAMNFINGVKEDDIAKIISSTIGIAGAIAGVVLSGLTGFGVALFFLGAKLIADAISDANTRGKARESYFQQTILKTQRNKLFHYTWMAKTNQEGHSDDRYNPFKLENENSPGPEQKNDEDDKPLFYTTLTGDVDITPEMAGSVDGLITYNTDPNSDNEGFKGFHTRIREKDDEVSHLIYASHVMIPDTGYITHENQGKDSIQADGTLLKGDDTIVSGSINAKIDAGEGNDIIFISGREEVIDGGAGANIAIIDGKEGKVTVNIYGDGNASLNSGTKLLNIAAYIITGKGHKVIINSSNLADIVPILVCQGDGIIILRNPSANGQEAIVKEYGSKGRVKEGNIFKFHTVLNRVSIGEKTIAMQKGFGVKQYYDN